MYFIGWLLMGGRGAVEGRVGREEVRREEVGGGGGGGGGNRGGREVGVGGGRGDR